MCFTRVYLNTLHACFGEQMSFVFGFKVHSVMTNTVATSNLLLREGPRSLETPSLIMDFINH